MGRSCIIVRYMGKTVMLDCGVHPGFQGLNSLPFFDEVDLSTVDVMLVTHFHLDHCAAVPYVVGRTNFKGRIFMTHPTKAIFHTLLKDFVKVSGGRGAVAGQGGRAGACKCSSPGCVARMRRAALHIWLLMPLAPPVLQRRGACTATRTWKRPRSAPR